MAFWINIYGCHCQPHPRHGPLSVKQLKNDLRKIKTERFMLGPGTKGQRDKLKNLPRDGTGRDFDRLSRPVPGRPAGQNHFWFSTFMVEIKIRFFMCTLPFFLHWWLFSEKNLSFPFDVDCLFLKKAFCHQILFWPFTVWINCSSDLKILANSRPLASN